MSRLNRAWLYWHTVKYLRATQVLARVRHVIEARRLGAPRAAPTPPLRVPRAGFTAPLAPAASMTGPDTFWLLNAAGRCRSTGDWNDAGREKLWLYNLHYFQDLVAEDHSRRTEWHRALVARWIAENPAPLGNGWEAYPLSMRIVNWIKWAVGGNLLGADGDASLAIQARHLSRIIEWHLLGNHLWANAKALIFAGAYFDGSEANGWLETGLAILRREIREQVLSDGGHFERSPMYHALILEDVFDLINLGRSRDGVLDKEMEQRLVATAEIMRRWLATMTHPDGEIAFFNDAAFGIAGSPRAIEQYAGRLGLEACKMPATSLKDLPASGYLRLERGDVVAFLDAGPIGPDYLPGHAHADTLSLELSVGDERVVVNGGTSIYGTGPQRQRERATAAHSTVGIDGFDSSEVWDGFRVARRAKIVARTIATTEDTDRIAASHDGYMRLPGRNVHTRVVEMKNDSLVVRDSVSGTHGEAVARFHFGEGVLPTIEASGNDGSFVTAGGRRIRWRTSAPAQITPSQWHPRFGVTVPTHCLSALLAGGILETTFSFERL